MYGWSAAKIGLRIVDPCSLGPSDDAEQVDRVGDQHHRRFGRPLDLLQLDQQPEELPTDLLYAPDEILTSLTSPTSSGMTWTIPLGSSMLSSSGIG